MECDTRTTTDNAKRLLRVFFLYLATFPAAWSNVWYATLRVVVVSAGVCVDAMWGDVPRWGEVVCVGLACVWYACIA